MTTSLEVRQIGSKDAYPFLLEIHYARRIPSISFAYGLFDNDELIGVCTYGTSASSSLAKGVCGPQWSKQVIELNRLCLLHNRKNEASILVGASLRMLPRPKIVISYADTSQDHLGIVYQATNFYYTGLSAKRTDWKIKGQEHLHGITIADKMRNVEGRRVDAMRAAFGDDFYLQERPRKHRYVIFMASKTDKKQLLKDLRYPSLPYPQKAVQVS